MLKSESMLQWAVLRFCQWRQLNWGLQESLNQQRNPHILNKMTPLIGSSLKIIILWWLSSYVTEKIAAAFVWSLLI